VVAEYPLTVIDDLGRTVVIDKQPQRIVSMLPSLTETLFAVGAGDRVVGVTTWCNYPEEATTRQNSGDLFNPNVEEILALEPDLILTGRSSMLEETLGFLEENGIPYIVVDPKSLDEIETAIVKVAQIAGLPGNGADIVAEIQAGRAAMAAQVAAVDPEDRPDVFILVDIDYLFTVGSGEFLSEMIEAAGGNNVAAGLGAGYFMVSEEDFIELDPDVIISTFPDQVLQKESWGEMRAIKAGRVHDVDDDLVKRPGPRVVLGLEELYGAFFE
jgi:iron complex transport system substrate-binding protein